MVRDGQRRVASVRERGVLPEGTAFYEAPLTFRGTPAVGPEARRRRLERVERELARVRRELAASPNGTDTVMAEVAG